MRRSLLAALSLATVLATVPAVQATEVWPNRTYTFSKAAFADHTLPENQDRITDLVWITRASTQGIFNIQQESIYETNVSPIGTEWATGEALDYNTLTFKPWQEWAANNPPATVGVNAVVHLIAEDIYIDIVFTSWGSSFGGGGAFSYRRGVPPVVSVPSGSWGRIKRLYR